MNNPTTPKLIALVNRARCAGERAASTVINGMQVRAVVRDGGACFYDITGDFTRRAHSLAEAEAALAA